MEWHRTTLIVCRGYRTHLPEFSAMHHTVLRLSHYLNHCIGCQSSNVSSTNSLLWHTESSFTNSHPTCSNISIHINLLVLCVRQTHCSSLFHQPKLSPLLVRSVSPPHQYGTIYHPLWGNHHLNINFCVNSRDTCFNASSVDHSYIRRLCIIVFTDFEFTAP